MIVEVRLFAAAREAVGDQKIHVHVDDDATVADLRAELVHRFPELAPWAPHLLFAVDRQLASDGQQLTNDVEIACFPPVSGG